MNTAFSNRFGDGFVQTVQQGGQTCVMGELTLVAGAVAGGNYKIADGSLLPINQNQALFSILGTYYGGDGMTTFGLPDLTGLGPGNTTWVICVAGIYP